MCKVKCEMCNSLEFLPKLATYVCYYQSVLNFLTILHHHSPTCVWPQVSSYYYKVVKHGLHQLNKSSFLTFQQHSSFHLFFEEYSILNHGMVKKRRLRNKNLVPISSPILHWHPGTWSLWDNLTIGRCELVNSSINNGYFHLELEYIENNQSSHGACYIWSCKNNTR